jgi:hypothetical protein
MPLLFVYLNHGRTGKRTGFYSADSKKLPVCDNRRIHQNNVFRNIANRDQSSTGWFYGFNVFIVTNEFGELIRCGITTAAKADNHFDWMM